MGAGLSDVADFEAKYPRDGGVAGVPDPLCCQAEHWTYLRTTNLIVSPFATVRQQQRVTKGVDSPTNGLLIAVKLLAIAQR